MNRHCECFHHKCPEKVYQFRGAYDLESSIDKSFRDLAFEKKVILEVTMIGARNLALQPDVYCIIFQSLEVISKAKLDTGIFHAMDA